MRAALIACLLTLAMQAGAEECPTGFLKNGAVVFDAILICVTDEVPNFKLKHAANVAAQWLDNDQNGSIDDPILLSALQKNKPILLMSEDGFNFSEWSAIERGLAGRMGQDLAAQETAPLQERDASQEEIHHLILTAGWIDAFRETFSVDPRDQSELYLAWRKAEDLNLYNYDDPTCDDNCKVVEFFYLATAAYLGSTTDVSHDELRVKTRQALTQKLPEVVRIIEAKQRNYPRNMWPDGNYKSKKNIKYD